MTQNCGLYEYGINFHIHNTPITPPHTVSQTTFVISRTFVVFKYKRKSFSYHFLFVFPHLIASHDLRCLDLKSWPYLGSYFQSSRVFILLLKLTTLVLCVFGCPSGWWQLQKKLERKLFSFPFVMCNTAPSGLSPVSSPSCSHQEHHQKCILVNSAFVLEALTHPLLQSFWHYSGICSCC